MNARATGTAPAREHARRVDLNEELALTPQGERVAYLNFGYAALREQFGLTTLPPRVLITCGWPSRRARGRAGSRVPVEILVSEWKDNETEAAMISVHPERFHSATEVLLCLLHAMAVQVGGRGQVLTLGLRHDKDTGDVSVLANDVGAKTLHHVEDIAKKIGSLPAGFANVPEPKVRPASPNRQLKWVCSVPGCGAILRASKDMGTQFSHNAHRPYAQMVLAPETVAGEVEQPAPAPEDVKPARGRAMAAKA